MSSHTQTERCLICLQESDDGLCELSVQFGCKCLSLVHEGCLGKWIMDKIVETGSSRVGCVSCGDDRTVWKKKEWLQHEGPDGTQLNVTLASHRSLLPCL